MFAADQNLAHRVSARYDIVMAVSHLKGFRSYSSTDKRVSERHLFKVRRPLLLTENYPEVHEMLAKVIHIPYS